MSDKDKRWGYSPDGRFQTPDTMQPWKSRYDFNSEELQNLVTQNISAVKTLVFDVGTAGQLPQNPLEVVAQGRAFEIKGITSATEYDFQANTGIETVATQALVGCWVNKIGGPSEALFLKNGDGFRGDFNKLYFFWPVQDGLSVRLNIFTFDDMPWTSGDFST